MGLKPQSLATKLDVLTIKCVLLAKIVEVSINKNGSENGRQ